jgi:hypothetical protein
MVKNQLILTIFCPLMQFPVILPEYVITSPILMVSLVVHSPQVKTCPEESWAPLGMSLTTEEDPEIEGYAWERQPSKT